MVIFDELFYVFVVGCWIILFFFFILDKVENICKVVVGVFFDILGLVGEFVVVFGEGSV